MEPAPVSVIICAYSNDRWQQLVAAVESLQKQQPRLSEIIVVSDHNDELRARVQQQFPNVIAIANSESRGLSGARNAGLAVARGEIVAFLDDDATVDHDWLRHLLHAYQEARVIGVGGTIEPRWELPRPRWFPPEFDWVVGCTYRGMPEHSAAVRNLIGANMSFRRSVFEDVGGFRSGIGRVGSVPVGCEETEFCIRASQCKPGSLFMYLPEARVFHWVPKSRATWRYFRQRCFAEGRSKLLVSRFVGIGDGLATEMSYTLRTLPRGVLLGIRQLITGDVYGLLRAGTIIAGLGITTAGYLKERIMASQVQESVDGNATCPRRFEGRSR